jgi:maltose/moltooligosaccharide transporter
MSLVTKAVDVINAQNRNENKEHTMIATKARMSLWQIINMNVGFFGIQFSFGLQQSNMSPIYSYLGADEASLPLLWLAGPMTGLLVQPIIGALSDRTTSRLGRRTPYFLIGAILCSLCLIAMPYSPTLWMAASLLWILDAANNVTMEPYRAFVSDKVNKDQHAIGFLTQSAFTGLAQTLAYLAPSLLVWFGMNKDALGGNQIPQIVYVAFGIGALLSITSILWSVFTTREDPLPAAQIAEMKAKPFGFFPALKEVWDAAKDMPPTMKQLAVVYLFQWYALFCYWQYITLAVSKALFGTTDASTTAFRDAGLLTGQMGAFYNFVAFASAFAMIPLARSLGSKSLHFICLLAAGIGMLAIPEIRDKAWMFLPMIGVGIAWGSIMGNPYVMLAGSIPPERTGVYMGIFNMFIVIPMMIQIFTLPLYYKTLLGGDPQNAIRLGGALMICAAIATLWVKTTQSKSAP